MVSSVQSPVGHQCRQWSMNTVDMADERRSSGLEIDLDVKIFNSKIESLKRLKN